MTDEEGFATLEAMKALTGGVAPFFSSYERAGFKRVFDPFGLDRDSVRGANGCSCAFCVLPPEEFWPDFLAWAAQVLSE